MTYKRDNPRRRDTDAIPDGYCNLSQPQIYLISTLFSPAPPASLPPYPATSHTLVNMRWLKPSQLNERPVKHIPFPPEYNEAVTYHPLLTDSLHSLLLCHCLIQTSPKEHLRHAYMVARLARICDGYPVFLAARSPSRADWIEILRRTENWIGLEQPWETLSAPAPLPDHMGVSPKKKTKEQVKERQRQEAIMEALADEQVYDEATVQATVTAREKQRQDQRNDEDWEIRAEPRRWAQEDGKEYPVSTERAGSIARWVKEAPINVPGTTNSKRSGKREKIHNLPTSIS